ncbi:hypothetical protein [Photorhabdus bodei]|uniref:Gfo/Idh/MocA-like oxidoreductase N-terminal domain-containing protein n=1 Tax=Photorhabdus bodei TaxID=2029681 RepID=A0ABX0AJT6_9GAMM|nr:hypothetical protein [Photorhabdus bodei]NDK98936.1 hypothetical protein [Photorhabdus bodei]NDL03280.1 hypothetical protein [Photorhabdus bodei]NDL07394.1 hypothetical protein [Photorhabdus bodei]
MKKTIKWGIIGCGDVTEVKIGPAFYKLDNSELVAVMRRLKIIFKVWVYGILCRTLEEIMLK